MGNVKTNFLFRTCVNRLAVDGTFTIANVMAEVKVKGLHRFENREKICWKLLRIYQRSKADAIEKLRWYAPKGFFLWLFFPKIRKISILNF
jgi:hypothetical protein